MKMNRFTYRIATASVISAFLLGSPTVKSDDNLGAGKEWVFSPPESYLGSSPTHQTDYMRGVLDTLNSIRFSGVPEDKIIDCIFDDKDSFRVLALSSGFANLITNDRVESGDTDFSVASELFRQLEHECKLDRFRD